MFSQRVASSDLSDRLDASYYHPEYLRLTRLLTEKGAVHLGSLVKNVACGPFGASAIAEDLYAANGVIFVRPVNISSSVFDDSNLVQVPKDLLLANNLKVYDGVNLYFGRVGVPCVAVLDAETSISPNIVIATPDPKKADPYYLYAFAGSRPGLTQLKRKIKEVAQPTTSTDSVRDLLVLDCDEFAQEFIGDKLRLAEQLRAWAQALLRAGKLLVEALVSGQITEKELVDAQQALERGDGNLDRAILERLRTDCVDGDGKPLFPDLDQFCELLGNVQRKTEA